MKSPPRICNWVCLLIALVMGGEITAAEPLTRAEKIRTNYAKFETMIPMRDGVQLFTSIYVPYTIDVSAEFPILMVRTPYSSGPYGANVYRGALGPSEAFEDEKFIFVYQDVRGRYMSQGEFVNMRPHIADKTGKQVDESSDTYDTVEWLIQNVPHNNGRVGQWGISYPGFYTAAGCIDSHPALKAVSPQAPIADWFFDDFHRNGAFVLPMAFSFFSSFGVDRPQPTALSNSGFPFPTKDGYQFYLDLGPLANVNDKYFHGEIDFWNALTEHPNYDQFWQSRNLLPHLKNVHASVLVVGGLFDTEDLYGPLSIYQSIERNNPNTQNTLVMGPWYHGGWNRTPGRKLGDADFDFSTAEIYRNQIELPFFVETLKGDGPPELPEAMIFETGANRWRMYEAWPPRQAQTAQLAFAAAGKLADALPDQPEVEVAANDAKVPMATADVTPWLSDPNKPVPYTEEITTRWARDYMTEDQRFAARRPDVLVFRGEVLTEDLTLAGPLEADLFFSTSGGDADLIVKLIDEYPGQAPTRADHQAFDNDYPSGRQQLVRAGVMRARFRDSFENPSPLTPGSVTKVQVPLRDVHHTFRKGHRVMVQIQSSWFPFIDRNPQTWVPNIFAAEEADFQPQIHRLFHSQRYPSQLRFLHLPAAFEE